MNKKLESRIARLERMMNRKSVKNEATDPVSTAIYIELLITLNRL